MNQPKLYSTFRDNNIGLQDVYELYILWYLLVQDGDCWQSDEEAPLALAMILIT